MLLCVFLHYNFCRRKYLRKIIVCLFFVVIFWRRKFIPPVLVCIKTQRRNNHQLFNDNTNINNTSPTKGNICCFFLFGVVILISNTGNISGNGVSNPRRRGGAGWSTQRPGVSKKKQIIYRLSRKMPFIVLCKLIETHAVYVNTHTHLPANKCVNAHAQCQRVCVTHLKTWRLPYLVCGTVNLSAYSVQYIIFLW